MKELQHKNKNGVWTKCEAKKRACRYRDNSETSSHRYVEVQEPAKTSLPQTSVEETLEEKDYSYDESAIRWNIRPDMLDTVKKRVDAFNARLAKTGAEEKFEYTTETTFEIDPETGLLYEKVTIELNRPTLKHGGWSFVGRVDEISNEHGENSFITSSLAGEQINGNYEVKSLVCDHCGQKRHRNKTYILRNEQGEYKQVGANCMRPFLGVTPNFWSLDPDYVQSTLNRNLSGSNGSSQAFHKTEELIALGLALSDGGKAYAGSKSEHISTKQKVLNHFFDRKNADKNVSTAPYLEQAREIIANTDFSGDSDYAINMRSLIRNENTGVRQWGYVLSAIPVWMKQNDKYEKREAKVPYTGYVGVVGDKMKDVPAKIVTKRTWTEPSYTGYGPDVKKTLLVAETSDRKLVKWVTTSSADEVDKVEEGNFIHLRNATIKEYDQYNNDEQTVVTRAKFNIVK